MDQFRVSIKLGHLARQSLKYLGYRPNFLYRIGLGSAWQADNWTGNDKKEESVKQTKDKCSKTFFLF